MAHLTPYLRFAGNCRDAMTFYQGIFGGTLTMQTVGETPMREHMPPALHDHILHSDLRAEGMVLMASDMSGPDGVTMGNAFAITLTCANKDEIERLFAHLSEGGTVGHPLEEAFFGTIGDCIDRFGVPWMLQCDPVPAVSAAPQAPRKRQPKKVTTASFQ